MNAFLIDRSFYSEFKDSKTFGAWAETKLSKALDQKILPLFLPILLAAKNKNQLFVYLRKLPVSMRLSTELTIEFEKIWELMIREGETGAVLNWLSYLYDISAKSIQAGDSLNLYYWKKIRESRRVFSSSLLNQHYKRLYCCVDGGSLHRATVDINGDFYGIFTAVFLSEASLRILLVVDFGLVDDSIVGLIRSLPDEFCILDRAPNDKAQLVYEYSVIEHNLGDFVKNGSGSNSMSEGGNCPLFCATMQGLLEEKGLSIAL